MSSSLKTVFGAQVAELIESSKVLVVGAGGIGCELLKNLVSSGFQHFEVIDLDTIEVSNLNRQFLFRKWHVGQSKALVAAKVVKQFYPLIAVDAHLGNIKSGRFDADYFQQFDIVLNALDNTEARRHVNRMCLSCGKSFVESGTQGFSGQIIPVIPKLSACWECTPKQSNQKTYPVCTIRSTPDKPVHCIVWAKLIFALLFGPTDDTNIIKDLKVSREQHENINDFVNNAFRYLFEKDIIEQLSMDDKWTDRQKPICISLTAIESDFKSPDKNNTNTNTKKNNNSNKILSVVANVRLFMASMIQLLTERETELGKMVFDKDDKLAMKFVSAAANLRMHCYHIDMQSEFENKGVAGNIIHAIATTNAIVAGAMVIQAIHILRRNKMVSALATATAAEKQPVVDDDNSCKNNNNNHDQKWDSMNAADVGAHMDRDMDVDMDIITDVNALKNRVSWVQSTGSRWLYASKVDGPNSKCFVCQQSSTHLTLNPQQFNFGQFKKRILLKFLGFKQPDITINNTDSAIGSNSLECILEDEDEEERAEKEALYKYDLMDSHIKIFNGATLIVDDFYQDTKMTIIVHFLDLDEEAHAEQFVLSETFNSKDFTLAKVPDVDVVVDADADADADTATVESKENNNSMNKMIGKKRKQIPVHSEVSIHDAIQSHPPTKRIKQFHISD